jgi:hypothetical protein
MVGVPMVVHVPQFQKPLRNVKWLYRGTYCCRQNPVQSQNYWYSNCPFKLLYVTFIVVNVEQYKVQP